MLEFLASADRGVSLTDTASSLRLPKSSALMLLRTLVGRGYVKRNDEDLYVLNATFRRHGFGWGGSRLARLVAAARPVMKTLCEKTGETVILGALDDEGRVRLLAKHVAGQSIRYDVDLTARLPAYCTAIGRVLLGSVAPERRDAILKGTERTKRTPVTVTDLDRLHRIVADAVTAGYTVLEEEFALGGTGVAAPIVDRDGRAVAALDVACVTPRFPAKRKVIVSALLQQTAALSRTVLQVPEA